MSEQADNHFKIEAVLSEMKGDRLQMVDETQPAGKLRLVTLSTGVRVTIRRMNMTVLQRLNDSFIMPQAPVQEVARPDGAIEQVANELDPAYVVEVAKAERKKMARIFSFASGLYIKLFNEGTRGLNDEQREELAELEEAMQAETGKELDGRNDESKYIINCAIGAAEDYALVTEALFARADDPK